VALRQRLYNNKICVYAIQAALLTKIKVCLARNQDSVPKKEPHIM